jgi:hypothetical protein
MAYTVPSARIIRPWNLKGRRRYGIYSASLNVGGTDGESGATYSTGTANKTLKVPPGRIVGVQFGKRTAAETYANATSGTLVSKAESTAGVQIFTAAATSAYDGFKPLGTAAVDEGRAATAATDGFSGGFPIRGGIFTSISSGTDGERVTVDYLVRHCTYVRATLTATSGADGAGACTYTLPLGGPGVLAAVALDFTAMPATTDITIKNDDTNGTALFTSTNSATDLAPSLVGRPGADEGGAATAATDGTEAANAFHSALFITMAEADAFTTGDETVIVELWIDD